MTIFDKLRPWQHATSRHLLDILSRGQNALDISDTGTGKTYVACAVASQITPLLPTNGIPEAVAVIPKIAYTAWRQAANHFNLPLITVGYEGLRMGRLPLGHWEHQPPVPFKADEFFVCESCQCMVDYDDYRPCHCHPNGTHCIKVKKHPWKYGRFIWDKNIKLIIFDEIHRCGGLDSLNADMLIAAKRQGIRVLGLSATAACTPLQMRALGYALDLHGLNQQCAIYPKPTAVDLSQNPPIFSPVKHLPTFYQWAAKYDCRPDPVYRGMKWFAGANEQKMIMAYIHNQIIPERGVRVRTSEIPGFPERLIIPELYDIENPKEINTAYAEATQHPLTEILRARQRAELSKLGLFTELATDEMAKGNSVAIFICFRATLDALRQRLQCDCFVDGSTEGTVGRDAAISAFQTNTEKLIILNNAAGGISVSLQDLTGEHPRVSLISPSFSATEFLQVCGRTHRAGGKSKSVCRVVLAANTVEEKVFKALKQKEHCIEALCDGDLNPNFL